MRLAFEFDVGTILPVLLYRLCTMLVYFDGMGNPEQRASINTLLAPLAAQDMYILFGGNITLFNQSCLRLAQLAHLQKPGVCKQPPDPVRSVNPCSAAFSNIVRPPFVAQGSPPILYRPDFPLDRFDQIVAAIAAEPFMCPDCKTAYTQETKSAKLQLWKDLPRIFNVVCFAPP